MNPRVEHRPEEQRYVLLLGDDAGGERIIGELEYVDETRGDQALRSFTHTGVRPEFRGNEYASLLVTQAFRDLDTSSRLAVPVCPYVRKWVRAHPDMQRLVAT